MAMAKMRPFSGQNGLSSGLVGNAAVVLKHASDLADSILNGSISLDNAYEEACLRKGQRAVAMAKICSFSEQTQRQRAITVTKVFATKTSHGDSRRVSWPIFTGGT